MEVYLEKQCALNKDNFYLQYDPAELLQYHYKDQMKNKAEGKENQPSLPYFGVLWSEQRRDLLVLRQLEQQYER